MTLEALGYDPFFETNRTRLGFDSVPVARVTAEHKGAYDVINEHGEFLAKITGKQIFDALSREDYPAVGDWVAITELNDGQAVIHGIIPRKTIIKRTHGDRSRKNGQNETQIIAANIDTAFVVESVDRDFSLNRFERYFTLARDGGVQPAIILNKTDLLSKQALEGRLTQIKERFPGVDILPTSAMRNEGFDALKASLLPNRTYCFLGSSGVGKSSLINSLLGRSAIRTGHISSYSGRGKHVTTGRQMYFLEHGGILIDNPGMREVGIADSSQGVETVFDEIAGLAHACKFPDCTHTSEPDCAVLQALQSGALSKEKYANYIGLKKEAAYSDMNDFEKKEKDRQFGKFLKQAKKDLKNFRHKDY